MFAHVQKLNKLHYNYNKMAMEEGQREGQRDGSMDGWIKYPSIHVRENTVIHQRSAVTLHTLVRYSRGTRKVHEGGIVYKIVSARVHACVQVHAYVHERSIYLTLFTSIPLLFYKTRVSNLLC